MKATTGGILNFVPNCYIDIPDFGIIKMQSLPEISDSKQAVYNSENIIGRSFPLYTYSHSGDRSISIQIHFFIMDQTSAQENLANLRGIQSAVYPRLGTGGAPYLPPVICTLKCGELIAKDPICAILQSYSVKFPTEVAFFEDDGTYCPYRFDVDTSWLIVYTSSNLPFNTRIIKSGGTGAD